MRNQSIILFANVHKVMKADRLLRSSGIACRVIPVPGEISSECGMCLLVEGKELDLYKEVLEKQNIQFEIHKSSE